MRTTNTLQGNINIKLSQACLTSNSKLEKRKPCRIRINKMFIPIF